MSKAKATKTLNKAHIALDAAQRAVLDTSPRTDVRLCDLLAQGGPVVEAYHAALKAVDEARFALRQFG